MNDRYSKQIADPIHGTIGLTRLETQIIDTQAFQRLRNVKQLGAVDFVFPGANYSRFSHSLGVCHVAGKILESIEATPRFEGFSDHEWQRYRLAALLHDVGHYPFSHTMENALEEVYGEDDDGEELYMEHEAVGGQVVQLDPDISSILEANGFEPASISAIFQRDYSKEDISIDYADVISSGLDADRLDYLRRSAHYSGVPYGSIDFNYLISQFQVDEKDRVCLTKKALLAADHFLLSRWFEYQQMIFHKTVQAADMVFEDLVVELMKSEEEFSLRPSKVKEMIETGEWAHYTDEKLLQAIHQLESESDKPYIQDKCRGLLKRHLPKKVYQKSTFQNRKGGQGPAEDTKIPEVKRAVKELIQKEEGWGIPEPYWYIWEEPMPFTKIRPQRDEEQESAERRAGDHAVRLANEVPGSGDSEKAEMPTAQLIVDEKDSVTNLLAENERYIWRIYVLFPSDEENNFPDEEEMDKRRKEIEEAIDEVVPSEN
jgi:HD superfamily phosphohydrolase